MLSWNLHMPGNGEKWRNDPVKGSVVAGQLHAGKAAGASAVRC